MFDSDAKLYTVLVHGAAGPTTGRAPVQGLLWSIGLPVWFARLPVWFARLVCLFARLVYPFAHLVHLFARLLHLFARLLYPFSCKWSEQNLKPFA